MTDETRAARNAIAKVIDDAPFLPTSDARIGDLADLIIAHLWQTADDPAVVEAVVLSGMLFPGRVSEPEMKQQRALAAGWILRVLTALLGPRPEEQETE